MPGLPVAATQGLGAPQARRWDEGPPSARGSACGQGRGVRAPRPRGERSDGALLPSPCPLLASPFSSSGPVQKTGETRVLHWTVCLARVQQHLSEPCTQEIRSTFTSGTRSTCSNVNVVYMWTQDWKRFEQTACKQPQHEGGSLARS